MDRSKIDSRILGQLEKLEAKYEAMGQDLSSYLDGLLYSDYLTYWDYIHLDTLLSLQNTRTGFPDEKIFIIYHQITELYFNLILHELSQLQTPQRVDRDEFLMRIKRCNRYFKHLIDSFEVMVDGMDQKQFLAFRMSLLPASGFQSAQYRFIEIRCTEFVNLIKDVQGPVDSIEQMFPYIYWKRGATELSSGKKTLTLRQFEEKYRDEFVELGESMVAKNLWTQFKTSFDEDVDIEAELRELDSHANVNWPLAHYKSAVRYLHQDPVDIAASGGTNWQKYLPPRFQKVVFFKELWSPLELDEWGKGWVLEALKGK